MSSAFFDLLVLYSLGISENYIKKHPVIPINYAVEIYLKKFL